ncbi:hypothetical protein J6590_081240 [Homalodisca vitripennis]|nr:hypothetical protein J6590_081240 [Homalodisca vitripennis]
MNLGEKGTLRKCKAALVLFDKPRDKKSTIIRRFTQSRESGTKTSRYTALLFFHPRHKSPFIPLCIIRRREIL